MAKNQQDLATHFPAQINKKKKSTIGGQQKKEELEKEVAELRKMLNHEQKVHEFLEKVYQRKDDSSFNIPNYLPPKMKELLAELAMVENEIAKLEGQISKIQCDVNKEKENNNNNDDQENNKSKQGLNNKILLSSYNSLPPNPNKFKGLNDNQKLPFETKALHFISKAIKGDYGLNDFRINNEKLLLQQPMKSSSKVIVDNQEDENQFHQQVRTFGERISKKSGMIKTPSPLREPRNPTPRRERNAEIPKFMSTPMHELQPKIMQSPIPTEEDTIHRWPPNKLSENIMKCLVFIFIRLLRTTRAMELEKSGPIASRSSNFSMSFRVHHEPNSKSSTSTSLLIQQKDSRQQDPYGIFDSEESIPRDIGPYKNLVIFGSTSMEAKCISNSNSIPLFQKLKFMMNSLQNVDLRLLNYQQKLAFWINMYNACIMHGFLQHGLPSSSTPEKLLSLMNKATLNIGGNIINAHAIEHFILRKPVNSPAKEVNRKGEIKNDKESILRELHGLESYDPNVMFALCCGTRSSPAVKIYTSDGVIGELEKSKLEYLQASLIVTSNKKIAMPELLLRNIHDFAQDLDSLVEWICQQLPTSGSLRKSIVDCFKGLHGGKASTIVEKIPYDFEFQYLLSA
ncbi:hypothetical protein CQW23_26928 [Capsicum baccatum]|uniref:DUF547 domain-containing protein n=1 Tax=Capsicum baccatum TaxID=33114 RepID=A0A2G2VQ73_CAPBA|nr:uncharacterized protein LOC107848674 [Capsicum annuum]PHT35128.1 hypothetical protein CQW23_26928 [Capsicum baccatum]